MSLQGIIEFARAVTASSPFTWLYGLVSLVFAILFFRGLVVVASEKSSAQPQAVPEVSASAIGPNSRAVAMGPNSTYYEAPPKKEWGKAVVKVSAHIAGSVPPYRPEIKIGGIEFLEGNFDLRLDVVVGDVPVKDIQFKFQVGERPSFEDFGKVSEWMVLGVAKLSTGPDVYLQPSAQMTHGAAVVTGDDGKQTLEPMVQMPAAVEPGAGPRFVVVEPIWSFRCPNPLTNSTINLIIRTSAFPKNPSLKPLRIHLEGSFLNPSDEREPINTTINL